MSKAVSDSLAVRLRRLRLAAGLTAYQTAQRAGMSPQVYYRIEGGDRPDPRFSSMRAIAEALGVSLDVFR